MNLFNNNSKIGMHFRRMDDVIRQKDAFLINQNFELDGFDNQEIWTQTGSPNPNYTSVILRGSQSCSLPAGAIITKDLGALYSRLSLHFLIRFPTVTPDFDNYFIQLMDASLNQQYLVSLRNSNLLQAQHGANNYATGSQTLSATTIYHIWIKYQATTAAANGIGNVYITSNNIRGNPDIQSTNGEGSLVRYVRLGHMNFTFASPIVVDQIVAQESDFTSVDG